MDPLQHVFNIAVTKLLAQGRQSRDSYCLYRNGVCRCAIGHLIDDEHYHPGMEHKGIAELLGWMHARHHTTVSNDPVVQQVFDAAIAEMFPDEPVEDYLDRTPTVTFLAKLQDMHDDSDNWSAGYGVYDDFNSELIANAEGVAAKFNLYMPEIP